MVRDMRCLPCTERRSRSADFFRRFSQAQVKNDRYAFLVEWVDPVARITWKYELLYYVKDGSIEMARLSFMCCF